MWRGGGDDDRKHGVEYNRSLTLRNIGMKTIRFEYELPHTKYFSMEYPIAKTLPPGVSCSLKVVFRPVRMVRVYICVLYHYLPVIFRPDDGGDDAGGVL